MTTAQTTIPTEDGERTRTMLDEDGAALVRDLDGRRTATTDPATVREWWQQSPSASYSLALGPSRLIAAAIPASLLGQYETPTVAFRLWDRRRDREGYRFFLYRAPDGKRVTSGGIDDWASAY